MRTEHQYWYSPRLGHDMGVAVFGHWGPPLLAFPTSHGDEWELQRHGMVDALAEFIDGGRVKLFCVGSNNHESFLNSSAHPFHRSWRQRMFDEYIREEVFPFIYTSCQTESIRDRDDGRVARGLSRREHTLPVSTPRQAVLRALRRLRLEGFMDGLYDDNFYFHNPVDYLANLDDPWLERAARQLRDPPRHRIGTVGREPLLYTLSGILAQKGIRHYLDDWGPRGGHDWPYWKDQMREYLSRW